MKLLKSILFLAITLSISCTDNDVLKTSKITGKWNVTEFNSSGTWETINENDMYAQFNSDHTYSSKFMSNHYSGTWEIEGEKIIKCNVSGVYVIYTMLDLQKNKGTFEVKEPGYKPYSIKAKRL